VTLPLSVVSDRSLSASVSSSGQTVGISPQDVPGRARGVSGDDVTDCYEATVVLAKQSPYIYGLADARQVTPVLLLAVSESVSKQASNLRNMLTVDNLERARCAGRTRS